MSFISYAQNFEDVMLWRALQGAEQGFYIDVGAHDPAVDSVTLAFYERGWRGINVEPVPDCFARVAALRPRDVNLGVALSDRSGTLPFYEVIGTGMSTLSREIADQHRKEGLPVVDGTIEVRTLAEICAEHAPECIHFLKIDVEGAEREVLAGADFRRHRPWIVLVEATEPAKPTPNHQGWEPLLLTADYEFIWFDGLNRFYAAAERIVDLRPHFGVPPNVFDDFVHNRFVEQLVPIPAGDGPFGAVEAQRIVSDLYRALLLREPDRGGLESFASSIASDGNLTKIVARIVKSPEFGAGLPKFLRHYGICDPAVTAE